MTWGEKLRATLRGDVQGGDVAALIASSAPLGDLQQRLADRTLEEQIAHPQDEWAAYEAVAEPAAPLWVAGELVRVAESISDAEGQAMSPAGHDAALTLLDPLEDLLLDASASLADPHRRSALRLPLRLGRSPGGGSGPLVKGMAAGVDQLAGDVAVLRADVGKIAPTWSRGELGGIDASLAAADTKIQMIRSRTIELLAGNRVDNTTLRAAANDLWDLLDMLLTVGQKLTLPRLMAGYPRPAPATVAPSPAVRAPAAPQVSPAPVAPVRRPVDEGPVMPEIAAGRTATGGHMNAAPPAASNEPIMPDVAATHSTPAKSEETAMPDVASARPTPRKLEEPAMPEIGAGRPQRREPPPEDEDLMPDIGGPGLR